MKKLTIDYHTVEAHRPCPTGASRYLMATKRLHVDLHAEIPLTDLVRHIGFVADDFAWWMSKMRIGEQHLLRLSLDILAMHAGHAVQGGNALDDFLAEPTEASAHYWFHNASRDIGYNAEREECGVSRMVFAIAAGVLGRRSAVAVVAEVMHDSANVFGVGDVVEAVAQWLEDLEFHGQAGWHPVVPVTRQIIGRGLRVSRI